MTEKQTDTGGPAFPHKLYIGERWNQERQISEPFYSEQPGAISLRDYFAAQSIAGINPGRLYGDDGIQNIAEQAYKLADAMLEARK